MSALPTKADMAGGQLDVSFVPRADIDSNAVSQKRRIRCCSAAASVRFCSF
jgi:hypothetical protein